MSDASPGTGASSMDVQVEDDSTFVVKRPRTSSPSPDRPDKTSRTNHDSRPPQEAYVRASYLLRAVTGAKVFANPCRVSQALHHSPLGKYVLEGETRALGNGCALIIVIWEHNIPKVTELGQSTLTLGDWEVTCRRAERDDPDYNYARVGPLDDSTDIGEVRNNFRSFDGGEVVELTWIPPSNLPRSTTGKWLRLKVRGTLPTKISISQLVYWVRPYLLPLLRCPGCHRIGHSLNTCRSQVRCSRCSGPHPSQRETTSCTRPFFCFQCGGPHGPRSAYCPFNCRAQQLYADLAREGKPLQAINKQLRELDMSSLQTRRRPPPSLPSPAPTRPYHPPPTTAHPGVQYSAIVTRNRFGPLEAQDDVISPAPGCTSPPLAPPSTPTPSGPDPGPLKEALEAPLPQDDVISPAPDSTPSPPVRRPGRPPGYLAPPSTPTPSDPEPEISYHTTVAEVHQQHSLKSHKGQRSGRPVQQATSRLPSLPMPPRPSTAPQAPVHPAAGPTSAAKDNVISSLFTLLWKGYHLYQKGTPVPEILTYLWPTLSTLISSLFE